MKILLELEIARNNKRFFHEFVPETLGSVWEQINKEIETLMYIDFQERLYLIRLWSIENVE